ncbi:hypothetical protein DITRI_Ditri09bG0011200 [Diplodiscus trichospermus]
MLQYLLHDLILLENQIPWLVLDRIFCLTDSPTETQSLIELTIEFFGNIFSSDKRSIEPHLFANQEIKHILDLLRKVIAFTIQSNGILEMPSLLIQETTETILRNLISFKQCYPNCAPRVTSYAVLLSHLINTPKDLDILCDTGIIDNWLIPEDSTKL